MPVEDLLPDSFKRVAFHPSAYIYAWKKKNLEKLFEELQQSNLAIKSGEAWVVEDKITRTIPLKNGQIKLFEWENVPEKDEEWYDFVERSTKESLELIGGWDLEKTARPDLVHKIWYHFEFVQEK